MSSGDKLRQLIERVRREPGWTVEVSNGGHYRVRSPHGGQTFLSVSSGDQKAWLVSRMCLRRIGWPH